MKALPAPIDFGQARLWERALLKTAARFVHAVRPPPAAHFAAHLFADGRDLAACGLLHGRAATDANGWPEPSITLGGWRAPVPGAPVEPLRCRGDRHPHACIISPTGGGKTWTTFLPTLLGSWSHSAVIFDVKGELHRYSSGYRSTFSHTIRFAPAELGSARYNPLDAIRPGSLGIGDARNIAEHLAPDDSKKGDRDSFWDVEAKAYIAGVILFVLDVAPPEDRCLAGVAKALAQGAALGEAMIANEHPDLATRAFIRDAASRLWKNPSERFVGSVVATANNYVGHFTEPLMAEATRTSDFRPSDLMCREYPVSLYLCSRKPDLERTKPLLRVLLSQTMAELQADEATDRDGQAKRWKLLWALDELPVLGRLANLGTDLPVMRSHGMRALMGAQGVQQLRATYGDTAGTILANARLLATRQNGLHESKELSALIGETVEVRHSVSRNFGGGLFLQGRSESEQTNWRVALQPAEIARLPADRLLIMGEDRPVMAWRSEPWWWQPLVREPAATESLS